MGILVRRAPGRSCRTGVSLGLLGAVSRKTRTPEGLIAYHVGDMRCAAWRRRQAGTVRERWTLRLAPLANDGFWTPNVRRRCYGLVPGDAVEGGRSQSRRLRTIPSSIYLATIQYINLSQALSLKEVPGPWATSRSLFFIFR